ncbi:hypothetical protein TNCV_4893111 [Trichonephila clavipes]|nr:hypothetical protein TNCV_4893111 [Trichonephila clavipes]
MHDFFSVLPDLETRQKDPFSIGVLVKGKSLDSISPGLSRMYKSGVREGRTALEGQQVADLHVVFLGQRCSPINGEQRLTGYLQMSSTFLTHFRNRSNYAFLCRLYTMRLNIKVCCVFSPYLKHTGFNCFERV